MGAGNHFFMILFLGGTEIYILRKFLPLSESHL